MRSQSVDKPDPFFVILAYWAIRLLIPLLGRLPMRLLYPLSRACGILCYRFLHRDRERTELNLRLAFGDRLSPGRMRLLTKGTFLHLGMMSAECLHLFSHPRGPVWDHILLHNRENLSGALAQGHGAVVFTAHFGNWEHLAAGLFHNGFTGLVLSRKLRSARFQTLVKSWRDRLGILEWNTEESPKALLQCLRKNLCIGVLNDQDIRRASGIFVDFFGIPAYTPRFVSEISYKTGAPLVPCLAVRRKDKSHIIKILPGIEPRDGEPKDAYVQRSQQEYASLLEKLIRRHPTQWVWFHRRWKTRPGSLSE